MRGFHFCIERPSGNAGDDALAYASRELLAQIGINEWTTCNLRNHVTRAVVEKANEHDIIVVGGGGLFLQDTNRNDVSGWQWKCPIELLDRFTKPLVVLSVGYNAFRGQGPFDPIFTEHVGRLIETAAVFSVRNEGSRAALADRHGLCTERVLVCPCPSLFIRARTCRVTHPTEDRRRIGIQLAGDRLGLRIPDVVTFERQVDALITRLRQTGYDISFVDHNWNPDSNMADITSRYPEIPRYDASTLWRRADIDRLLWFYQDLACVIAMRGHGQMIPFGQGTPVVSWVSHDKLRWFLEDGGMAEWGVEVAEPRLADRTLELLDRAVGRGAWAEGHDRAAQRFQLLAARTLERIRGVL